MAPTQPKKPPYFNIILSFVSAAALLLCGAAMTMGFDHERRIAVQETKTARLEGIESEVKKLGESAARIEQKVDDIRARGK